MPSRRFLLSLVTGLLFSTGLYAQNNPQVEEMLSRASKLVNSGSLGQGTQLYKEVLELKPDNVDALFSLVQIADATQDFYSVVFYGKAYEAVAFGDVDKPEVQRKVERAAEHLNTAGRLKIQIYPEASEVRINGLLFGIGSVEMPVKPQEKFVIEATLKDHVPFNLVVNLRAGEEKLINKSLDKIAFFGELQIKLLPPQTGVDVFIDAANAGQDITTQKLAEGRHLVCFRKAGFDRWWRYVDVPRNDKVVLEAQLQEGGESAKPCDVMPGPEFE